MIHLVVAALIALALAGSHWKAYTAGKKNVQASWNVSALQAKDAANELERINRKSKESALEIRTKQIMANVAAANGARAESERLLSASQSSLRTARDTHQACVVSASTHAKLLGYCEQEYRGVAERADGHTADIKALEGAWPVGAKE